MEWQSQPIAGQLNTPDGHHPGPGALHVFDVAGGDVGVAPGKQVIGQVLLGQHTCPGSNDVMLTVVAVTLAWLLLILCIDEEFCQVFC